MAKKPTFRKWEHTWEWLAKVHVNSNPKNKELLNAPFEKQREFLAPMLNTSAFNEMSYKVLNLEAFWHQNGSPYFKIWPGLVQQLQHTSINIDCDYLSAPYPVFNVCLARETELAKAAGPSLLVAVINREDAIKIPPRDDEEKRTFELGEEKVRQVEKKLGGKLHTSLLVYYMIPGDISRHTGTELAILHGDTIQQAFERVTDKDEGMYLMDEHAIGVVSIAVAVCFFGVGMHDMVAPDVKQNVVLRKRIDGMKERNKTPRQILDKHKQWLVGSEIDLPRDLVIHENGSGNGKNKTGRELQHGHIRSGHMRMQPCGEGRKDRKLIFVPPTWVRPDLPTAQQHGYRIGRREELTK